MKLLNKIFKRSEEEEPEEYEDSEEFKKPNRFYGGRIHKLKVYS